MKAQKRRMLLLGMLLISLTSQLFAQQDFRRWINPTINGTTIRQGLHIEWYRSMDVDPETNWMCVTWSDTRLGNRDIFAQLYDEDGNPLWEEGGVIVSDFYGRQEDPHVMPAGNGEWIISWIDYRDDWQILDKSYVFMQRLSAEGERMWEPAGGIPVCRVPEIHTISVQSFSDAQPDENGRVGAISIWVDGRGGPAAIYAQHISRDGEIQWVENGLPVMEASWDIGNLEGFGYSADVDGQGGLIVAAHDKEHTGNQNLYCQYISGDGILQWPQVPGAVRGVPLCISISDQDEVKMAPDGRGGAFFVWIDKRNDPGAGDIYGQHIAADGSKSWLLGLPVNEGFETDPRGWTQVTDELYQIVDTPTHSGNHSLAAPAHPTGSAFDQCRIEYQAQPVEELQISVWFNMEAYGRGDNAGDWGSGDAAYLDLGESATGFLRVAVNENGRVRWIPRYNGRENEFDHYFSATQLALNTWYQYQIRYRDGSLHLMVYDEAMSLLIDATANTDNLTIDTYALGASFLASDASCYFDDLIIDQFNDISFDEMDGTIICNMPNIQEGLKLINSGDGESILVWEDSRQRTNENLYAQKLRLGDHNEMILEWGAGYEGVLICNTTGQQIQPRLTEDGFGGAVVSWIDIADMDMYIQRLDDQGQILWGDLDGFVISDCPGYQEGNIIRMLNDERVVIAYSDKRSGSPGLYYQIFEIDDGQLAPNMVEDGVEIIFGIDFDAKEPGIGSLVVDEFAVFGWIDKRFAPFGTHVYVQKVDYETGDILWQKNGVSLTPGFSNAIHDQEVVDMDSVRFTYDEDGNLYAAWQDRRYINYNNIAAQKLDPTGNGTQLWTDVGILIAEDGTSNEQQRPFILTDGEGGAFIVYDRADNTYYHQLYIQHIDGQGERVPAFNTGEIPGVAITDVAADHFLESLAKFEDGSILIVYNRNIGYVGDLNYAHDLFAQRISTDGELLWGANGVTLSEGEGYQFHASVAHISTGFVIVWEDTRRGAPISDIYGQVLSNDGTKLWAEVNGRRLIEEDNAQYAISAGSANPTVNDFWIAWEDSRIGDDQNIYVQRYLADGTPLLEPANGVIVSSALNAQKNPKVLVNQDNSAFITWQDNQAQNFTDLRYAQLNRAGMMMPGYGENGNVLCDAYHQQKVMTIADTRNYGFVAVWEDLRATGKDPLYNVYAQRVIGEQDTDVEEGTVTAALPKTWNLEEAYPNPFNPVTRIAFDVPHNAIVKLTIYDVLGQVVNYLVDEYKQAGHYEVTWNGRNLYGETVSSGKYFYRLVADGEQISRSAILLK